jgi:hypothetical protein
MARAGLYQRVRQAITTSSDAPVVAHSEVVVHQAIGIMMQFLGCSNLVALDALAGQGEQAGQPLLAVALDLGNRFRPAWRTKAPVSGIQPPSGALRASAPRSRQCSPEHRQKRTTRSMHFDRQPNGTNRKKNRPVFASGAPTQC